ncbi:MAG: hypothetical protein H7Z37_14270, partial [Pyrinomonadaceae bacterium]|nr:hypothetical protein [Pyrinomonadaceae bacterium]
MSNSTPHTKILGRFPAQDFVSRHREFAEILKHAKEERTGRGLLILAPPSDGASELLRQVYDTLFFERGETIPFYFDVNKADVTAENAARRFLQTFLLQTIAFRRNEPALFDSAPELRELAELAAPEDLVWINPLVAACEQENRLGDVRSFVRNCLSAPLRAAAHGVLTVVMIDDFHQSETFDGDVSFVTEVNQIYERSTLPFVISGRRRFVLGATQNGETDLQNTAVLRLSSSTPSEIGTLTQKLADLYEVTLNEQTRDLIVQKLESNPTFITNLLLAARDKDVSLDNFKNFQQLYVEEMLGGRINRYFAGIFDEIASDAETQREILSVLFEVFTKRQNKSSIELWRKRISVPTNEFYKIMRRLHLQELIRLNSSVVEISEEETVSRDYIRARHRLEIETVPRALVYSDLLAESLKRAPQIMARYYRRSA